MSIEANQSVDKDRGRQLVLDTLHKYGPLTCYEVEQITGLPHQSCSARFSDLKRLSLIEDTGDKRPTNTGRRAAVYRRKRWDI